MNFASIQNTFDSSGDYFKLFFSFPYRGSTPIEYMGNSEAVTQPGGARLGFNRGTSSGKGPHKISSSLAMSSRGRRLDPILSSRHGVHFPPNFKTMA